MSGSKGTIFIVDDERPVRLALERLLRSAGYRCMLFANGRGFLEILPYDKPGCVLLDLRLSDQSGLDVQSDLRNQDRNLPVIFMSGYGNVKSSVEAMRCGAIDFLTKPIEDAELLTVIDSAVNLHRQKLRECNKIEIIKQRYSNLSPREQEVLRCVISGARIKNISIHLGIAEKTVKIHKARVMKKMQAQSVIDLYQLAVQLEVTPEMVA